MQEKIIKFNRQIQHKIIYICSVVIQGNTAQNKMRLQSEHFHASDASRPKRENGETCNDVKFIIYYTCIKNVTMDIMGNIIAI